MAIIGLTNDDLSAAPSKFGTAIFNAKTYLKAQGWNVLASGDGTSYNASGDLLSVEGDWTNTNAWFVLTPPNGGYHLCFQYSTSIGGSGRVSYSALAAMSDGGGYKGAASATVPWSAADETFIFGTSAATANYANTTTPYSHIVTSDEEIEGQYPIYFLYVQANVVQNIYGIDVLFEATRFPSWPSSIIGIADNNVCRTPFYETPNASGAILFSNNYEGRAGSPSVPYQSGDAMTVWEAQSPGSEVMTPFEWGVSGTVSLRTGETWTGGAEFTFGMSALMRQASRAAAISPAHAYPDRSNAAGPIARLFTDRDWLIPWPTGVTPL